MTEGLISPEALALMSVESVSAGLAYLERARLDPQRIRVIDANRPPALIRSEIEALLEECFPA